MQLRHIGIVCQSLPEALTFYKQWFGCKIEREMHEAGQFVSTILGKQKAIVNTVKLSFPQGDGQLELLQFEHPTMQSSTTDLVNQGVTHLAIRVQKIKDLYQAMKQSGVEFLSPPQLSEDGGATVCFCLDPNGTHLELVEVHQ